jgi:AraC-like DNA-binding protein
MLPRPKVIFIAAGTLHYQIADTTMTLRKGAMLLRPGATVANWEVLRSNSCDLHFAEYEAFGLEGTIGPLWTPSSEHETELGAMRRLRALTCTSDTASRLQSEGELKGVLARFTVRAVNPAAEAAQLAQRATSSEAAVHNAISYLGLHFAEPAVLTGLAERMGLSEDHFRRIFRRITGVSAQQYLRVLRINTAKTYLAQSTLPVKEIAHLVGYDDPLYFSRAYHKSLGCSPKRYRDLNRCL